MMQLLLLFAVVVTGMTAFMVTAWLVQRRLGNAGWIDVFWTFGSGGACVAVSLWPSGTADPARQAMVAALAGLWSLRLGTYIAWRVVGSDEDLRYTDLRRQWGEAFQTRILRFVLWQPPVTAVLTLSVLAAAHAPGPLGLRDMAGLAVLALAILGEAIADRQMSRYKRRKDRPPVLEGGLWGLSRHPNYFFEWLAWLAYPIIAFTPFSPFGWATLAAPAIMYLVLRYGSGLPMLEASMARRKGQAFRDYQARVNAFFPAWPRAVRTGSNVHGRS